MFRRARVLLQVSGSYINIVFLGVLVSIHMTSTTATANGVTRVFLFTLLASTLLFTAWIFRFFQPPNPSSQATRAEK